MSSFARRALVGLATPALATALMVTGPGQRLANVDGDTRAPLYDRPLDDEALRRAGEVVPDEATYYVEGRTEDAVLLGNLKAASQLYLAPALPVLDFRRAEWFVIRGSGGRVRVMGAP